MNVVEVVYKGLIERGRCTMDDIPEEHREGVKNLLEGTSTKVEDTGINEDETLSFGKHGAITIPNINCYSLTTNEMVIDNRTDIIIPYNDIFTSELFQDEYPKDVNYFISRVENNYMAFKDDKVDVSIDTVDNNCVIHLEGSPRINAIGRVMLRMDIRIESSNYEDMHLTIYAFGK